MSDFSLVVSYPGKTIEFSNCDWISVEENINTEGIIEKAEILAKNREEILNDSEDVSG